MFWRNWPCYCGFTYMWYMIGVPECPYFFSSHVYELLVFFWSKKQLKQLVSFQERRTTQILLPLLGWTCCWCQLWFPFSQTVSIVVCLRFLQFLECKWRTGDKRSVRQPTGGSKVTMSIRRPTPLVPTCSHLFTTTYYFIHYSCVHK